MRSAVIVYESMFGNTARVARWLAEGLESEGTMVVLKDVGEAAVKDLSGHDIVLLGSPTHHRAEAARMRAFIAGVGRRSLSGVRGLAFDTRSDRPLAGSAARSIRRSMAASGLRFAGDLSIAVRGRKGPPEDGAHDRAVIAARNLVLGSEGGRA